MTPLAHYSKNLLKVVSLKKQTQKYGTQKGHSEVEVQRDQAMLTVYCGEINVLI